ncbi:MAG TPA: TetR family transcriptional regulator, partial [Micromonosporaceae bacterium]|nr:TetR family transcriptional regulator [Micromonosporaceae bacterium]
MGRSSTARERILAAACELMLSRGYGSIGVAEICARADVKKGSFYHFFE